MSKVTSHHSDFSLGLGKIIKKNVSKMGHFDSVLSPKNKLWVLTKSGLGQESVVSTSSTNFITYLVFL